MSVLPLDGVRLVVTLPPAEHFSGVSSEMARDHVPTLRRLGAAVYEFDTSAFYQNDFTKLQEQIKDVASFRADAVIGVPNAGYAAQINLEDGDVQKNVFFDILELPTILYWDHALIQAPGYVLRSWPSKPFYSTGMVRQSLRALLLHPLVYNFFNDFGPNFGTSQIGHCDFRSTR